jgi:tryptophan-rich sensory protein
MEFSVLAFFCTLGCCLVSWIIAGKTAIKEDYKEWFKNLSHPKSLFMIKYMNIVGIAFYLVFGYVLYHLFVSKEIVPIVIAIVIILQMGLSPFLMYKTKDLKLFFFAMLDIPILVLALIFFSLQTNLISAILLMVYFLYLVYDLSYFFRLMKLNK